MDMNINNFIIGEEYIICYPDYGDMIKKIIKESKYKKTSKCAIKEINNNESNICNFIKDCESYKCVLNEITIDDKYFRLIFKKIKKMNNNSTTIKYINKELIEITGYLEDNIIDSYSSDIIICFKKYDKIYKEKLIEDNLNKNYNKTMAKLLYNIYDKLEIDITDILKDS